MPLSLDLGSTEMQAFELQRRMEDFSVEAAAMLDQQHDDQGGHRKVMSTDGSLVEVGGLRFLKGPLVLEADGNDPLYAAVQPPQITANQHNYDPPNLATAIVLELESDAARSITGLVTVRRRRMLRLVNRGNYTITLSHSSSSSTVGYRFAFSHAGDFELRSGGIVDLYYDAGSEVWRGEGYALGIRSIQYGTVTIASGGSDSATATITSVDANKSVLSYLGHHAAARGASASITLTDATTVTATRDSVDNSIDIVTRFVVVEYV